MSKLNILQERGRIRIVPSVADAHDQNQRGDEELGKSQLEWRGRRTLATDLSRGRNDGALGRSSSCTRSCGLAAAAKRSPRQTKSIFPWSGPPAFSRLRDLSDGALFDDDRLRRRDKRPPVLAFASAGTPSDRSDRALSNEPTRVGGSPNVKVDPVGDIFSGRVVGPSAVWMSTGRARRRRGSEEGASPPAGVGVGLDARDDSADVE
jgi:hypothetical protein